MHTGPYQSTELEHRSSDGLAAVLDRAVEWMQVDGAALFARLRETATSALAWIDANPQSGWYISGGVAAILASKIIGPTVRENEAALFRTRIQQKLWVLTKGKRSPLVWIIAKEEKSLSGVELNRVDDAGRFQPPSLTNDRGRLQLNTFVFEFDNEPVQTADGAVVIASGSVSFRLARKHLYQFVTYALESFSESFRQRVRSAIFNEIGAQRRDAVIGHQTASCGRVEDELKKTCEGPPAHKNPSGLGIIIESVNVLVRPAAATGDNDVANPGGGESDNLVSLDTIRMVRDLIEREETPDNREFLRHAFGVIVEAARTIEVARELGSSGNLIVATPDESGLTKGAAAAAHLQQKSNEPPSPMRLVEPAPKDAA